MKTVRAPNLTDCFRLLAALAIVFLHSGSVSQLSAVDQDFVLLMQTIFASWALPFFYCTTARFALASVQKNGSFTKVFLRVRHLIFLAVVYTAALAFLYLGVYFIALKGAFFTQIIVLLQPPHILTTLINSTIKLTQLNPTSAHFLLHAAGISIAAFFAQMMFVSIHFKKVLLLILLSCLIFVVFIPYHITKIYPSIIEINHLVVIGICVGFLYQLIPLPKRLITKTIDIPLLLNIYLLPICMVGIPTAINNSVVFYKISIVLFGFVILYLTDLLSKITFTPVVAKISEWGQKYSLAIFVIHPLVVKIFNFIIPPLFIQYNIHPALIICCIFVVTVALTTYLSVKLFHFYPSLVSSKEN